MTSEDQRPDPSEEETWVGETASNRSDDETRHLDPNSPERRATFQFHAGDSFGSYRIVRPLGRGGMGEVYEAEDTNTQHSVAVKILDKGALATSQERQRFLREGLLAASINHPNSLYIYGTEEVDEQPLIAMELAPGGTLKDRIVNDGPMATEVAVDIILQVIDGLDAAHRAGILHRDVKPANCFVGRDGQVKVGDYGLSISTAGTDDTQLTASGTILGTPLFAAPEQLRGDALDSRADIYSVGATLYYLLTGRLLFESSSGIKALAAILEQVPRAPHEVRHSIPPSLSQVVMKCLRKDAGARPQDYGELRLALTPFSSSRPPVAAPGRRFVSGALDVAAVALLLAFVMPSDKVSSDILETLVLIATSALLEGRWGLSLGKWILGLRLQRSEGGTPGLQRALQRATFLWLPNLLGSSILLLATRASDDVTGTLQFIFSFAFLVLFLPARRQNGWQAWHDMLSRTVVVRAARRSIHPASDAGSVSIEPMVMASTLGPYQVATSPQERRIGQTLQAYDPRLKRAVWIHLRPPGTAPIPEGRRQLGHPARLRWLNERRSSEIAWDAYEAVPGSTLRDRSAKAVGWDIMRHWLLDLAQVVEEASRSPELTPLYDVNRVWVSRAGRALLLDCPPPDSTQPATSGDEVGHDPQAFLREVACLGLLGREDAADLDGEEREILRRLTGTMPLHASSILRRLFRNASELPASLVNELRQSVKRPTRVTRSLRLRHLLLSWGLVVFFGIVAFLVRVYQDFQREQQYPGLLLLRATIDEARQAESRAGENADSSRRFRALQIQIAGPLRPVWSSLPSTGKDFLSRSQRAFLDATQQLPLPSEEEVAQSEQTLQGFLRSSKAWKLQVKGLGKKLILSGSVILSILLVLSPLHMLSGMLFRGGWSLGFFNMAIVTRDGARVSRRRAAVRSFLTWIPMVAAFLYLLGLAVAHGVASLHEFGHLVGEQPKWWVLGPLLFMAGLLWNLVSPTRGPEDALLATRIVRE